LFCLCRVLFGRGTGIFAFCQIIAGYFHNLFQFFSYAFPIFAHSTQNPLAKNKHLL